MFQTAEVRKRQTKREKRDGEGENGKRDTEQGEMVRRGRHRGLFPLRNLPAWVFVSQLVTPGAETLASPRLLGVRLPSSRAHTPFSLSSPLEPGPGQGVGRGDPPCTGAAGGGAPVSPHTCRGAVMVLCQKLGVGEKMV